MDESEESYRLRPLQSCYVAVGGGFDHRAGGFTQKLHAILGPNPLLEVTIMMHALEPARYAKS
jgi:hypothetical protein